MNWVVQSFPPEDQAQVRKARTLVYCTLLAPLPCFGFALQFAKFGTPVIHWSGLAFFGVLTALIPLFLRVIPSVLLWARIYCFLTWLILLWIAVFDGGILNGSLLNYPFIPILAIVFLKRSEVAFWTFMSCLSVVGLFVAEFVFDVPFPRTVNSTEAGRVLTFAIVTAILVTAGIFYFYEQARGKLQVELESRLRELEEKNRLIVDQQKMLVQSAQLSALGEMAGGVAHEINNPLAIIRGRTNILAELSKDSPDPRVTKSLESINGTVDRIAKIVDGLMRFHKADVNAPLERHTVRSICEDIKLLSEERFAVQKIRFELIDRSREAIIYCRPMEIAQVLINLLNNAFDAVKASQDVGGDAWVRVEVDRDEMERSIIIRIYDSGPPVPDGIREKIFHPFFTTKEVGSGTGLGLSVSLGIVESHGGELKLGSAEANKHFLLSLPLVRDSDGVNVLAKN